MSSSYLKIHSRTRKMVDTALMTALIFIATFSIRIPVPFTTGYIHPGDSIVFLSVLFLGPIYGFFAAGIGSAFSDLLGGYTFWIIPTFIIKGLMAYVVGYLSEKPSQLRVAVSSLSFTTFWIGFTTITFLLIKSIQNSDSKLQLILSKLNQENETAMTLDDLSQLIQTTSICLMIVLFALSLVIIGLLLYNRFKKKNTLPLHLALAYVIGGIIMIIGYYIAYGLITNNFIVPIFSIPSNIIQFIGGFIIASLLTPVIQFIIKLRNQSK